MQAAIAPILAGLAGPTAVAAGTAATTAATTLQIGSAVLGGFGAMRAAQGAKQEAEINSYIGRTRAMQTDQSAREGLNDELATIRATLGANGQRPNVGTAAIFDELRATRGRDRRIAFGNEMQTAGSFARQAQAQRPGMALAGGLLKAGPSLFDLYELRRGK